MANKGIPSVFASISYAERFKYEYFSYSETGSVAEWSKALVLGTSLIEAWVRIPPLSHLLRLSTCPVVSGIRAIYSTSIQNFCHWSLFIWWLCALVGKVPV